MHVNITFHIEILFNSASRWSTYGESRHLLGCCRGKRQFLFLSCGYCTRCHVKCLTNGNIFSINKEFSFTLHLNSIKKIFAFQAPQGKRKNRLLFTFLMFLLGTLCDLLKERLSKCNRVLFLCIPRRK